MASIICVSVLYEVLVKVVLLYILKCLCGLLSKNDRVSNLRIFFFLWSRKWSLLVCILKSQCSPDISKNIFVIYLTSPLALCSSSLFHVHLFTAPNTSTTTSTQKVCIHVKINIFYILYPDRIPSLRRRTVGLTVGSALIPAHHTARLLIIFRSIRLTTILVNSVSVSGSSASTSTMLRITVNPQIIHAPILAFAFLCFCTFQVVALLGHVHCTAHVLNPPCILNDFSCKVSYI